MQQSQNIFPIKRPVKSILNLTQLLDNSASKYPGRIALVFGARRITYAKLADAVLRLASSLYGLGVKESDRVALWLPNCPEFVYSFFAILRLRAVVVPVNTMLKREEVKSIIEDCKAKILICSIDKVSDAENILSRLSSLQQLICLPGPKDKGAIISFHSLLAGSKEALSRVEIKENDLAEIIYTSGTTGRPKGVCLTHKNIISNVKDCSQAVNFSKKDCVLCILPLFHSFSSTICMLLPLYKGAKIVIMRAVRPFKRVIRAIFKHKVSIFAGVPSIYKILNEIKLTFFKRLLTILINPLRLCISGAAALPLSVCRNFEKKYKRPLLQGYGLTEASPVVSLNPFTRPRKSNSVGVPIASVRVRIIDKKGKDTPPNTVGEILVKGPNVMQGYYNLEEETKKVLKEGWLYTGDLAKIDKDGFIYIIGRIKEMINVRGFNVYPREIEELLYRYPDIKETAIVGVVHKHRGEAPVAFIAAAKGKLNEQEILSYLRANLAAYKVPLKIFIRSSLPKNAAGKILKRKLQEEVRDTFK